MTVPLKPRPRESLASRRHSLLASTAALSLLSVHGAGFATEQPRWDCRVAPDGSGWACTKDGAPFVDPPATTTAAPTEPTGPVVTEPPQQPSPPGESTEPLAPDPPPVQRIDQAPVPAPAATPPQTQPPAAPPEQPAEPQTPLGSSERQTPEKPSAIQVEPASTEVARPDFASPTPDAAQAAPDAPLEEPPEPKPLVATPTSDGEPPRRTAPEPLDGDRPAAAETAALQAFDAGDASVDLLGPTAESADVSRSPDDIAERMDAVEEASEPSAEAGPAPAESASAAALPAAGQTFAGALDAGIDWHSCRAADSRQPEAAGPTDDFGEGPISVTADGVVAELDPQVAHFSGNVQLVQGSLELNAAELTLDRTNGEASAKGGVLISNPEVRVAGDSAIYRLEPGTGEIFDASYRLPARRGRGDASEAALLGDERSRYRQITYTTCSPDSDDWMLQADTLELDHAEGLGTAKHATLRFFGVPLLYAPTFTFPIDDRRRSGFLPPSIGTSDQTGADISVPYYLNLAPNYDLTLVPRLMSKRGVMLGGEFRFLTEHSKGELAAEFLPNDSEYDGDSRRGGASLSSTTWFNDRSTANLRLSYVSDDDYLRDLGDSLSVTSTTNLESTGELNYRSDYWDFLGRIQHYQNLDDTITGDERPYSRLPQLRVDLERPDMLGGTTVHLDAEYVNFYRDDSVRGHRLDLFPALSLPLGEQWWYVKPKAGARYTTYRLSDVDAGDDDSPDDLNGLFSLDGGLLFDRSTVYFGNAATHTLEPRAYYLLVPSDGQNDQPVFDTDLLDFGFENLFRENRFSGADRFGDANQLTLALTSRIIGASSGKELLRASIGQIFYFEDREVTLPGEPELDDSSSAVVTEVDAVLGGGWRSRAGLQWDPHDGDNGNIDQALAQLMYRDAKRDRIFNAAYRLRDGVTNQTDLATVWALNEQISLIGRHYYSLRDNRLLETLAGIEYGRCCWRLRAVARKFADNDDDYNVGFLLQLELTGLGRLGKDIDDTLERGIYGYR